MCMIDSMTAYYYFCVVFISVNEYSLPHNHDAVTAGLLVYGLPMSTWTLLMEREDDVNELKELKSMANWSYTTLCEIQEEKLEDSEEFLLLLLFFKFTFLTRNLVYWEKWPTSFSILSFVHYTNLKNKTKKFFLNTCKLIVKQQVNTCTV